MQEFSMHVLDVVQNSIEAGATKISIVIKEEPKENLFYFAVSDNGKGIDPELLQNIKSPFITTRRTRRVGLGLSLLEQTCEQCGGKLEVKSRRGEGTQVIASMEYLNIDRPPLGHIGETLHVLILMNSRISFHYYHKYDTKEYVLDMAEIIENLGGLSLNEPSVIGRLKEKIEKGLKSLYTKD